MFRSLVSTRHSLVVFASPVAAGFPSPADDYVEGRLDLNDRLVRRPAATFIVRAEGESMTGAGILPGDLLIVDRSLDARSGSIVIAVLDVALTVKRLTGSRRGWRLEAAHPDYPATALEGDLECVIWGVVTAAVHEFDRR